MCNHSNIKDKTSNNLNSIKGQGMDVETKLELIKRAPTEEILVESELRQLLETNSHPIHYQGFEISGYLHLGTLIVSGSKINDLIKAGLKCQVFLADWHSILNRKLGGDWEKIKKAAKYYEEAFKFFCPGVKVVNGSELYHNNDDYWKDVVRLSLKISLARITRCLTIMGRSENEKMDFAQYLYPPMQAIDIKYIGADIPHGGMDQRKIHALAREEFPRLGWEKPIALHHHLLMGLAQPEKIDNSIDKVEQVMAMKMSKSKPWTAIFIHDNEQDIKNKLNKAWCPEKQIELNPVLEIAKYVVFREKNVLKVERPAKFGGSIEFESYEELERIFAQGKLHPVDLKNAVADELNKIIEPIRKHFEKPANKKLLDVYKGIEITR